MKRAIILVAVFAAVLVGVLALTNVLNTWNLDSNSTGDYCRDFWGFDLNSGFIQLEKNMDLNYVNYGGTITMKIDISNIASPEDGIKSGYQRIGTTEFPASDAVYEELSELFGLEGKNLKNVYHKKSNAVRSLVAYKEPEHTDLWVVFVENGAEKLMYLGYSEDSCNLPFDAPAEE